MNSEQVLQRKGAGESGAVHGQRDERRKKKDSGKLQRKAVSAYAPEYAPPIVHDVLSSPGQPIDLETRAFMEPRFGHDFSRVRIHTDERAAESAKAVSAHAYTVGTNIAFAHGRYAAQTPAGRRLLAHELTHVVQQNAGSGVLGSLQMDPRDSADEREASIVERSCEQPRVIRVSAARPLLQRQPSQKATKEEAVSGEGGLISDESRKRASVILSPDDTLLTVAKAVLKQWTEAAPFTPPAGAPAVARASLDATQLAKGLAVYNRYYLALPKMDKWKEGLRFPLPIEINPVTGERSVNSSLISLLAASFDPSWEPLLAVKANRNVPPDSADVEALAKQFLSANPDAIGRGIHLSTRGLTNAVESEPFISAVFRQAGADSFDTALAFMDSIVIHQFDLMASQHSGRAVIDTVRKALAAAPANLSEAQKASLTRAQTILSRFGVFSAAAAAAFQSQYSSSPGSCMDAVYSGIGGLCSTGVSKSVRAQVGREARELDARLHPESRNDRSRKHPTNNMDRLMDTMRKRGKAGPMIEIKYYGKSKSWKPAPEAMILSLTQADVPGWYFFGLSLHGAYHSVILVVDKTDPDNPQVYWMDQFTTGFGGQWTPRLGAYVNENNVTGVLEAKMAKVVPSYGFSESKIWQILPTADTLMEIR